MQTHIFVVCFPLFNDRTRWDYMKCCRMKCIIVKTTQANECATMLYYLIVKVCVIDCTLGNRCLQHLPDVVQVS